MDTELPRPDHLEFPATARGVRPYANLYRFGGDGHVSRVVYVGGASSYSVYEERRQTAPTAVARAFALARQGTGVGRVELLCCPCPVDTEGLGTEWILDHTDAVSAVVGAPDVVGSVGYSAGAAYAATVALLDERARATAFFGAAGMRRTLADLRPFLEDWAKRKKPPLPAAYFANEGDKSCENTSWMSQHAAAISFTVERGSGGHPFAEYDKNGFVLGAFAFVLARLAR